MFICVHVRIGTTTGVYSSHDYRYMYVCILCMYVHVLGRVSVHVHAIRMHMY